MSSGGILLLFKLKSAPTVARVPFSGQYIGLTSADWSPSANIELTGGIARSYAPGYLVEVTAENSMDISRGQGSLAECIEGKITLADWTDSGHSLSKMIADGEISFAGATVWVAEFGAGQSSPIAVWTPLVQYGVIGDPEIGAGTVTLTARSAVYSKVSNLFTKTSYLEIPSAPDGQSVPTDPGYPLDTSKHVTSTAYSGRVYGGIPVTVKAGDGPKAQRICRWDYTDLRVGDISTSDYDSSPSGGDAGYFASTYATSLGRSEYAADYSSIATAAIFFQCRSKWIADGLGKYADLSDAAGLAMAISEYQQNGYRIVLSDGNWFLDVRAYTLAPGPYRLAIPGENETRNYYEQDHGYTPEVDGFFIWGVPNPNPVLYENDIPYAGIVFPLADYPGYSELFRDPPTATSVEIFAVPASINVVTGNNILRGLVKGAQTVQTIYPQTLSQGATFAQPSCADASSYVVAENIPLTVCADTSELPWSGNRPGSYANRRGFVMWEGDWISSGSSTGDLADINTDATQTRTTDAVTITATVPVDEHAKEYGWIDLRVKVPKDVGSLWMLSTGMRLHDTGMHVNVSGTEYRMSPYFWGPYWARPKTWGPLSSLSWEKTAYHLPSAPDWRMSFTDEESARHRVEIGANGGIVGMAPTFTLGISEMLLWSFSKISFSNLYCSVYPFFTDKSINAICSNAATGFGSGNRVLVTTDGPGYYVGVVSSDGSISWTAGEIPNDETFPGDVYGHACGYDLATDKFSIIWSQSDSFGNYRIGYYDLDGAGAPIGNPTEIVQTTHAPGFATVANGYTILATGTGASAEIRRRAMSGTTWTSTPITWGGVRGGFFNGSVWCLVGDRGIFSNDNFSTFTETAFSFGEDIANAIGYDPLDKRWVICGNTANVWTVDVASDSANPFLGTFVKRMDSTSSPVGNVAHRGVIWYGNGLALVGAKTGFRDGYALTSADGITWSVANDQTAAPMEAICYCNSRLIACNNAISRNSQILVADYKLDFIPQACISPASMARNFRANYFGGASGYNPLQWSGLYWDSTYNWEVHQDSTPFAISFDPPANTDEQMTPDKVIQKVCQEWWGFAGENCGDLNAVHDPIRPGFPQITPGALEDIATNIVVNYAKIGSDYSLIAYVQNVDKAYSAGNDSYYFGGWDDSGNTNGLQIWQACRDAYLKTGIIRTATYAFDSIHTAGCLGKLFLQEDTDLGARVDWICKQPRYLDLVIDGNHSEGAYDMVSQKAFCASRYTPNQAMLTARGLSLPERGVIVKAKHRYVSAEHQLQIAFAPE